MTRRRTYRECGGAPHCPYCAQEKAMATPKTPIHRGKKTYAFLGATAAAVLVSATARHGYDLGVISPDIADAFAVGFAALAAWARSAVHPRVIVTDTTDRPTAGPRF